MLQPLSVERTIGVNLADTIGLGLAWLLYNASLDAEDSITKKKKTMM